MFQTSVYISYISTISMNQVFPKQRYALKRIDKAQFKPRIYNASGCFDVKHTLKASTYLKQVNTKLKIDYIQFYSKMEHFCVQRSKPVILFLDITSAGPVINITIYIQLILIAMFML